uniref:Putative secreted protein n=1 Tax=Panstrongylus lignarius TaxID=156445 RepID=A0A224Y0P9_9HEMI
MAQICSLISTLGFITAVVLKIESALATSLAVKNPEVNIASRYSVAGSCTVIFGAFTCNGGCARSTVAQPGYLNFIFVTVGVSSPVNQLHHKSPSSPTHISTNFRPTGVGITVSC